MLKLCAASFTWSSVGGGAALLATVSMSLVVIGRPLLKDDVPEFKDVTEPCRENPGEGAGVGRGGSSIGLATGTGYPPIP
mmetsp:Transcript_1815/g.3196  ORF Transcript_1815/g.3196 Transcript_1815/m.3196 type:complete len:80 (+) Transcript_1815:1116-1355(+)